MDRGLAVAQVLRHAELRALFAGDTQDVVAAHDERRAARGYLHGTELPRDVTNAFPAPVEEPAAA